MRPSRLFRSTTASASGSSGTLVNAFSAAVISGQSLPPPGGPDGFEAAREGVPPAATRATDSIRSDARAAFAGVILHLLRFSVSQRRTAALAVFYGRET